MNISKEELPKKINDDNFITEVSKKYFYNYDKNINSFIEKKELVKIMKDISMTFFGCEPEKGAIESQFKKLDKDKNEKIDFSEFKAFIKDYLKMVVEYVI